MKAYDLFELAGRNLRESVLRNSLTTLGIAVGVASLVAMLSLGVGLQELAGRRLEKAGLFDTIIVTSRRDFRNFGGERQANAPTREESRPLDENARVEITKLPSVLEAYPDIRFITELRYQDKPHLTLIAGLPFSVKNNDAFEGMQGTFFTAEDAPEAILQKNFAEELLGLRDKQEPSTPPDNTNLAELAKPLLGKQIVMRYAQRTDQPVAKSAGPMTGTPLDMMAESYSVVSKQQVLKIVGVSDLDPDSMRGSARARIFIPLKLAESLHVMQPSDLRDNMRAFSKVPTYLTMTVKVKGPSQVPSVEEAIKKKGFNTFSILDATRGLRRFFAVLDVFLGIFGSLALAVASLGIINTLVMAILERRREIGIMKAIGGTDADIKTLFFAEAGAMGVLGGVLGVTLGWAIGKIINFGTDIYLKRQDLPPEQIWSVPWWLVAGAVGFSIVVSLISGLYPASRAAKLDPVQALRYE